jgi:poly(A) polymerase
VGRLDAPWLADPAARAVVAALAAGGFRAWFVGGAVRNTLLGLPPGDLDLATDAPPDQAMALAEAAGLKAVPTGIDHGTVTLVAHGRAFEVTTLRRDVETFGRRARVAFGADLAADAARRDFTINALYLTPDGALIDPVGGGADLAARRVRFVGDPAARITEDALRILRFFRFHAWYGDPGRGLDPEALAACASAAGRLALLSRERIGAEMRRLLAAPDPAPAVAAMAGAGVLAEALPGADPAPLGPLIGLEGALGLAPEPMRRLAALGGADPARALRLSRADGRRRAALAAAAAGTAGPGELGYRLGAEAGLSALALRHAAAGTPLPEGAAAAVARGAAARFPVTAADLAPALAGPDLGRRLAELEARWIASGFALTRAELLG